MTNEIRLIREIIKQEKRLAAAENDAAEARRKLEMLNDALAHHNARNGS